MFKNYRCVYTRVGNFYEIFLKMTIPHPMIKSLSSLKNVQIYFFVP